MPGPLLAALPMSLRRMARDCGVEAVVCLMEWRGGRSLYVPKAPVATDHELVQRVGASAADWLAQEFGGETVPVPLGTAMARAQRDREIRALKASHTAAEVARRYGLAERHIWRLWAGEAEDEAASEVARRVECQARLF